MPDSAVNSSIPRSKESFNGSEDKIPLRNRKYLFDRRKFSFIAGERFSEDQRKDNKAIIYLPEYYIQSTEFCATLLRVQNDFQKNLSIALREIKDLIVAKDFARVILYNSPSEVQPFLFSEEVFFQQLLLLLNYDRRKIGELLSDVIIRNLDEDLWQKFAAFLVRNSIAAIQNLEIDLSEPDPMFVERGYLSRK